jgi:hypothetical protein
VAGAVGGWWVSSSERRYHPGGYITFKVPSNRPINQSFIHRRSSIVHHNAWCKFEGEKRRREGERSRGSREVRRVKVHASEGSREGEV